MEFANLDRFSTLLQKGSDLEFFNDTVKNKMMISEWLAGQIRRQYGGGIPNDALVDAFFFSLKSALDCLAEVINRFYGLKVDPSYAWAVRDLTGQLDIVKSRNTKLADFIRLEFGDDKNKWFGDFTEFRNQATHGTRISKDITVQIPGGTVQAFLRRLDGSLLEMEICDYVEFLLKKANVAVEECYGLLYAP